jgi:hypothetical protein
MVLYLNLAFKSLIAYELDAKNGNTKWQDAMKEEIDALFMFITFIDHGKIQYLEGYKKYFSSFCF